MGCTPWPAGLTAAPHARLGDLGLEQFSVSELFSSILIPGFFLLACILQLHYFHRPFMQLTDLEHVPPPGACPPRWAHRCVPPPAAGPFTQSRPTGCRGACTVPLLCTSAGHPSREGRDGGQWVWMEGPGQSRGLSCPR